MAVNPSGICWVMTIPGILPGSLFKTSRVASVPPVDAPSPMIVESSTLRDNGGNGIGLAAACAEDGIGACAAGRPCCCG